MRRVLALAVVLTILGLGARLAFSEEDGASVDVGTVAGDDTHSTEAPEASPELAEDEYDADKPLIEWRGESPYWSKGQPFSAVKDAPFIGSSECLLCHEELKRGFMETAHARTLEDSQLDLNRQGCEMCHGAGGGHAMLRSRGAIFAFDWEDPAKHNTICLRCHEWLSSPVEWKATTHADAGLRCTTCHDPHVEAGHTQRWLLSTQQDLGCVQCHADVGHDFTRMSHHPVLMDAANDPTAGAMHCTSCHDVHAGQGHAMLATRTATETCQKCHIDKGGPWRFNHASTEDGISDGCLTCHAQHGSDNSWMHVADGRALCIRCHTSHVDHYEPLTCWASGCHEAIHGSNRSMLFFKEAGGQ